MTKLDQALDQIQDQMVYDAKAYGTFKKMHQNGLATPIYENLSKETRTRIERALEVLNADRIDVNEQNVRALAISYFTMLRDEASTFMEEEKKRFPEAVAALPEDQLLVLNQGIEVRVAQLQHIIDEVTSE